MIQLRGAVLGRTASRRFRLLLICLLAAIAFTAFPARTGAPHAAFAQEAETVIPAEAETDTDAGAEAETGGQKTVQKTIRTGQSLKIRVRCGSGKVRWACGNKKAAIKTVRRTRGASTAVIEGRKKGSCTVTARVGGETVLTVEVQVKGKKKAPGVFKNGVYYENGKKTYSLKKALSGSRCAIDFHGANRLFIGASRVSCAERAVRDPDVFFASYPGCGIRMMFRKTQSAEGFSYGGLKVIDSFLKQNSFGSVLIDLGGNDPRNIDAYISLYRTLVRRYPSARFWFVALLPREDGSNAKRVKFNRRLVIDLYDFALYHPCFRTLDGIHYDTDLTRSIYEKMMCLTGRKICVDRETGAVAPAVQGVEDLPGAGENGTEQTGRNRVSQHGPGSE